MAGGSFSQYPQVTMRDIRWSKRRAFATLLLFCWLKFGLCFVVPPSDWHPLRLTYKGSYCQPLCEKNRDGADSDLSPQVQEDAKVENSDRRDLIINGITAGLLVSTLVASASLYSQTLYTPSGFQRLPYTKFIAALGEPNASQGTGAGQWGIWNDDPGPRGVFLKDFDSLERAGGVAPVGWKFDENDWWLEEHGIIMESPEFPLEPGRYLVTGGRMVSTGLTIDSNGAWKLDEGKLYDVTHLPCRSARYRPTSSTATASPRNAKQGDFPVMPGAAMPPVSGFDKQDYAVLFLVGKAVSS